MSMTERMEAAMRRGIQILLVAAWAIRSRVRRNTGDHIAKTEVVQGLQVKKLQLQNSRRVWKRREV